MPMDAEPVAIETESPELNDHELAALVNDPAANDENGMADGANAIVVQAPPPGAIFPRPPSLTASEDFVWEENKPLTELYTAIGRALAAPGDLFRAPAHRGGLILGSPATGVQPQPVTEPKQLASLVVDRLRITHTKDGKTKGRLIPAKHLPLLLLSELFLQQFRPLDAVWRSPRYFPDFSLPEPGYNDRGDGQRILYTGGTIAISNTVETVKAFLGVLAFASDADRTNALAAALTVQLLRHLWPGGKPLLAVTSTKSHGGKDTVIQFATGLTPAVSISYQPTDWALERSFVGSLCHGPDTGVVIIENARRAKRQPYIASAFVERVLTDPEPFLWSTGTGAPVRRRNDLVVAISTNSGTLSEDLLNRGLPIRLAPRGDIHERTTPIGNPKLEFLPANRGRIEAELRGMIERWKGAGSPPDLSVKHPFTQWAQVVGGILRANGFTDFLANYATSKTTHDPLRQALGLLGAAKPDNWMTAKKWMALVADLGLVRVIVPENDRENEESQARGIGVILSNHQGETFFGETENERLVLRLKKARLRVEGKAATVYRFDQVNRTELPIDLDTTEPDQVHIPQNGRRKPFRAPQGEAIR